MIIDQVEESPIFGEKARIRMKAKSRPRPNP